MNEHLAAGDCYIFTRNSTQHVAIKTQCGIAFDIVHIVKRDKKPM
jgi:hypothetical protein